MSLPRSTTKIMAPLLGTSSLSTPVPSLSDKIPSQLCLNLSALKGTLRTLRQLDDGVSTRMNRFDALARDAARQQEQSGGNRGGDQDDGRDTRLKRECALFWSEVTRSWSDRARLLEACIAVVDPPAAAASGLQGRVEAGLDRDRQLGRGESPDDVVVSAHASCTSDPELTTHALPEESHPQRAHRCA